MATGSVDGLINIFDLEQGKTKSFGITLYLYKSDYYAMK